MSLLKCHPIGETLPDDLIDHLEISMKITKDITFDSAIPLLGIHSIHGGIDVSLLLIWSDLEYILLSKKNKLKNRIYGYIILHKICLEKYTRAESGERN